MDIGKSHSELHIIRQTGMSLQGFMATITYSSYVHGKGMLWNWYFRHWANFNSILRTYVSQTHTHTCSSLIHNATTIVNILKINQKCFSSYL